MTSGVPVLGQRELNRATLQRQLLVQQSDMTAAVEQGVVVRSVTVHGTQHVVTAADFDLVRPVVAPLLRRVQRNTFGRRVGDVDLDELVTEARELLAGGAVLTRPELGRLLARSRPGADPAALGWSVQYLEPVGGATPFALAAESARREATSDDVRQVVRRYLAAYGPAAVADVRTWSGVAGRELFDLPDAPRPPGDLPVPVRLLPEFDGPVLGFADRSRLMSDDVRAAVCQGDAVAATVLVDGTVAATWTASGSGESPRVDVRPLRRLSRRERAEVDEEAGALAGFLRAAAQTPRISTSSPTVAPRA